MRLSRIPTLLILAIGGSLALGACTSTPAGWTYAPPPSPTAVASAASSAGASAGASAAASAQASPPASVPASAAPSGATGGGTVLKLEASGVQYLETTLEAPAGQPFQIDFDNQDATIPHNVQISDSSGQMVFTGDTVTGPGKITYNVGALPAATYKFACKWHPVMTGTLTTK